MLATVISQYLQTNRRLVIPQLGALLVKEPNHTIIFSSLLKRDDGVLRGLLIDQGLSEIEASGLLDRALFDIRYAVENNERFTLNGIGYFSGDEQGEIRFEMCTAETQPTAEIITESTEAKEKEPATEAPKIDTTPTIQAPQETRFEPDPDLDGLSYGNRPKRQTMHTSSRSSSQHYKRKVDWWLIIGIGALVLALGAILYGFLRDGAGSNNSDAFYAEFYAE